MSEVTVELIKDLRARTGVGVAKCKEALAATSGDLDEAVTYLRKTGAASAVKKEQRETNEGIISVAHHNDYVAVLKINCETDFVANNEDFKVFAQDLATEVSLDAPANVDEFLQRPYSKDPSLKIDDVRVSMVQKMGENIQIDKFEIFTKGPDRSIGVYIHGGGRMVSVVELEGGSGYEEVAQEMAMNAVGMNPMFLDPQSIPADVLEKEKDIIREQIKDKPADMHEKIIEGKLRAYYNSVCLIHQKYIRESSQTMDQFMKAANPNLKAVRWIFWSIGG